MQAVKKIILFILFLTFGIGVFYSTTVFQQNRKDRILVFGAMGIPFSSDPLDFDYYIHHHSFTSVFARLVSIEKNAEIVPVLAEKWSNDNEFKVWKFKFRSNLIYSNGDKITLDHYVKSLKRIAYLKKLKNSQSGLLEYLKGFHTFNSIDDNFEGISADGNTLILKFIKPMPELLSKISFGFYSLIHPSLYDNKTGEWKKSLPVISSGPYGVTKWTSNEFELQLRENIPYVNYENRIRKVIFKEFIAYKSSSQINAIDFLVADKNTLMVDENFVFVGAENGLKIGYVKCHSWNKMKNPLSKVEVRRWFRKKFYDGLFMGGLKGVHEFFPVGLTDVKALEVDTSIVKPNFPFFRLLTHKMSLSGKIDANIHKKSMAEIFQLGLLNMGDSSGAELIQSDENYNELDLEIKGSGIEVVNYMDTVRLMFLSKDGIKLPDESGKIIKELSKSEPDINFINKEIWNQAIIWPIRHYSSGLWFNKNSKINYGELNFDSPAIDFQFLKWND